MKSLEHMPLNTHFGTQPWLFLQDKPLQGSLRIKEYACAQVALPPENADVICMSFAGQPGGPTR